MLAAALAAGLSPRQSAAAATCHPTLRALALAPSSVPGGASATATATLTCATRTALTVSLKGFAGVSVPSALHVAKGRTSVSVTIRSATTKRTRRGTIAAALGRVRKTASLTVTPTPKTCKTPALTGFSLPGLSYVGDHPAAMIRLSCAAAATVRLTLRSGNRHLPVPSTVSIARYYAAVTVPLTPKAYLPGQFRATVSVRYGSRTLTRAITVDPGLASVSIPPAGGAPDFVSFDVLITGQAPAGGLTVKLNSSSGAVTMPASITISAGALGEDFTATTVRQVTKNTTVKLSAALGGRTLSATTVLVPPFDSHDTMTITPALGQGNIVYGPDFTLEYQVTLSNPAPANGLNVTITAGDPAVELQDATAFITGGDTSGFFDINVASVTEPVHTTLGATAEGVSASLPVTIEPGLTGVTVPAAIVGGQSATGTVTLAGPVDTSTTVNLQSSWGIVTVPLSVTIPKGQSSVTFPISTTTGTSGDQVFITASLGTTSIESSPITMTS